jgi:hypothetical protein
LQEVRPELPVAVVRGDLLYVSYPCENAAPGAGGAVDDDVDAYRGVFRGFMCAAAPRWSPVCAGALPLMRQPRVECDGSSRRRLGAQEGRLQYFVCVSGHLHGSWLARACL